jgi:hypothetical protein
MSSPRVRLQKVGVRLGQTAWEFHHDRPGANRQESDGHWTCQAWHMPFNPWELMENHGMNFNEWCWFYGMRVHGTIWWPIGISQEMVMLMGIPSDNQTWLAGKSSINCSNHRTIAGGLFSHKRPTIDQSAQGWSPSHVVHILQQACSNRFWRDPQGGMPWSGAPRAAVLAERHGLGPQLEPHLS